MERRYFLMAAAAPALLWAQAPDDDIIFDQVRRRLTSDPQVKGHQLEVEVNEGVVTLKGVVASEKLRDRAEKLAKKVKGVKQVINQLRVG
jgi:hyperosmotically inducible protein